MSVAVNLLGKIPTNTETTAKTLVSEMEKGQQKEAKTFVIGGANCNLIWVQGVPSVIMVSQSD